MNLFFNKFTPKLFWNMILIQPLIFKQFEKIIFGFSTKTDGITGAPYFFNLSLSVGDDAYKVKQNQKLFFKETGISSRRIAFQKQVHGNNIAYVTTPGLAGESDAMITDKNDLGISVSTADCTAVFIYDNKNKIIAGVHSGWRGTEKKIVKKTLEKLKNEFNSSPENLFVYLAPSISKKNYEVGEEVALLFAEKYLQPKKEKFLLNVAKANYDMLINFEIPKKNIQASNLCTYDVDHLLHSYRRDGAHSGRAIGVIAMKGKYA